MEQENLEYQKKIIELRDQLQDATREINTLVAEYVTVKEGQEGHQLLVDNLQQENNRLAALNEEYLEEKAQWDSTMEEYKEKVYYLFTSIQLIHLAGSDHYFHPLFKISQNKTMKIMFAIDRTLGLAE